MASNINVIAAINGLPAGENRTLETHAVAIDKCRANGVQLIFEIGEHLQAAHDLLANHGDGMFGKWCVERCGMTDRTARNYINVVEVFGKQKKLVSETGSGTFDAKALYYLSRDTTPDAAIKDALKAAKNGDRVTLADARDIVARYTIDADADGETAPDQAMLVAEAEERIRRIFAKWPKRFAKNIRVVLSSLIQEDFEQWVQP